jgi:hypothetical protein
MGMLFLLDEQKLIGETGLKRWRVNIFEMVRVVFVKYIPGFSDYMVSEVGEVFSRKTGKTVKRKLRTTQDGYLSVNLCGINELEPDRKLSERNACNYRVHRLVALAFIPNPEGKKYVNHKDGDKTNNCVENLEWVTHAENIIHMQEVLKKEKHKEPVVQATLDGKFVARFESMRNACDKTGVDYRSISSVCTGRTRQAKGYLWFYEREFKEGVQMRKSARCKKVEQYTKDDKYIRTFDSVQEAAEHVGAFVTNISYACSGKIKSSKGFHWKYAKEKKEKKIDETEGWVELPDYPHDKISSDGKIYSKKIKKIKKQSKGKYKYVPMTDKDGNKKSVAVHRLVALAYLPNPNNYPIINHIDGNPGNNAVENLEWCSHSQNASHAHSTGLNKSRKAVIQKNKKGKVLAIFDSMEEASKATGALPTSISRACAGDYKTAGGYKWEYLVSEDEE